ncbi:DMT family transporter [Vibrio sp. THAF190c]|uniref:DMT family transporter n=1 Tax=Vibrio sp. THAF190c TaxID=2587865 RepID=UPI001268AD7D|nr:DMT family transporter [Vibrio sp. THAF190c]QFT12879.1 EamA-like transporter family protein [Vibrio sp. THAF190c]
MTAKGIFLALFSTVLFTLVAALVRQLSADYDAFQILFFRQLVFVLLLAPAMRNNMKVLLKPNKVRLHILRILGAFTALYLGFVTVSNIAFADATALGFLQVIFVALIARITLKEQVTTRRCLTITLGFTGVMLVVQPSFSGNEFVYVMAGVAAAIGAAIAVTCVRAVAQTEPKITLLAYQAVCVGLIALIPAIYQWQTPTIEDLLWLLSIGVISSIAQYVGISAYKWAEANIIANVEYVKIIYSVLIGWMLFSELPNMWAFVGVLTILASAIIPMVWSYFESKKESYVDAEH